MPVDPSSAEQVAPALLAYLERRIPAADISYADAPTQITHGWETFIYSFQLRGDGLADGWERPLILRIYPGADAADRLTKEADVQRFAKDRGYPAPRPLAVETDRDVLGLPFMVMERAPGIPMLDRIMANPMDVFSEASRMAELHVALHRLQTDAWPLPAEGPFVERRLAGLRAQIKRFGLRPPPDLEEAFAWIEQHRDLVAHEERSLFHGDFHPLNILVDDDGEAMVIDWTNADVGDRHADVANALVLLETAPVNPTALLDRFLARYGRGFLAWLYLRAYRRRAPLDTARLHFWQALRALDWWVYTLAYSSVDSDTMGVKSETPANIPPNHAELMRQYFWRQARPEAGPVAAARQLAPVAVAGAAVAVLAAVVFGRLRKRESD